MKKTKLYIGLVFSLVLSLYGCYSFKGIAIDPEVRTYYVDQFVDNSGGGVPVLAINFTEKLKDKIRNESRLVYSEVDPDITFSGSIIRFDPVTSLTGANNQLHIGVKVLLEKTKGEDLEDRTFNESFFSEFPPDVNFLDVREDLIEEITDQLVIDIFNKAFTNW
ncbi:MAG: LPS assembly lipoprotein LptE [Saprospiraceae bacterium]|nr:LPS assembly lipoprotein LptE [Saprospiraceae bacterium]